MERKSSTSPNSGKILSSTQSQREVQPEVSIRGAGDGIPGELSVAQVENENARPPDVKSREMQGSNLYERIANTKITDPDSFRLVAELGIEAKRIGAIIEEEFKPSIHQADLAHKGMVKLRNRALEHFDEAEILSKDKLIQAGETVPVAGVSFVERWSAEVVDAAAIPREYLIPDMVKIKAMALALKNETRIPGVTVTFKPSITFRT